MDFVAINDITDAKTLAHLFKYDSLYGHFSGAVSAEGSAISINGDKVQVYAEKDPGQIPWPEVGADIVIEPNMQQIGPADFHKAELAILQGKMAAIDAVLKIKRELAKN